MSTGTVFNKALSDALESENPNARVDMEKIQAFVNEHTGFNWVSVTLEQDETLTLILKAKQ